METFYPNKAVYGAYQKKKIIHLEFFCQHSYLPNS